MTRFRMRASSRPFITGIERFGRIKSLQFLSLLSSLSSVFCSTANIKVLFALEQFTKTVSNERFPAMCPAESIRAWVGGWEASHFVHYNKLSPRQLGPDHRQDSGLQ